MTVSEPMKLMPNGQITTGRIIPEIGRQRPLEKTGESHQSFKDVFNQEVQRKDDLKFSAHAIKRLEDRNISLSDKDISEINQAVSKAEGKGIRESLVVMKDVSFIVNIKNKTVITAVDSKNMKENVITNIDGAVFI